ncbi:hypothetical protein FB384_003831 [Prauserella sediminis]|uniref:Uncharacterized protein n=1 Tax=Prauserella sediminis TaxID=577680 RepID=A0A839XNS5_9PSEU|nr:hypothetical protein [Prauserella sediminis]
MLPAVRGAPEPAHTDIPKGETNDGDRHTGVRFLRDA